jgi:hypothetical protein
MEITREIFEDILKILQESENIFSIYRLDDNDVEVWEKYPDVYYNIIDKNRKIEKHRWYENSETIIQIGDWFIGAYGPTQLYSEMSTWEDIYQNVEFYEVEKVEKTIYDYVPVK